LCYPQHTMDEAVTSGTYCLHTCHGHPKTEMICDHSLWSNSPTELSCHASSGNKSQNFDILNLGSRVSEKLRELRGKEDKPNMKTKIDGKILTMNRVNNNHRNNNNHLNNNNIDRPEPAGGTDIQGNNNFFLKLKSSQDSLNQQLLPPVRIPSVPVRTPSVPVRTPSVPDRTPSVPGRTQSVPIQFQQSNFRDEADTRDTMRQQINKPQIIRLEIPSRSPNFPNRFTQNAFSPQTVGEDDQLFQVGSQLLVGGQGASQALRPSQLSARGQGDIQSLRSPSKGVLISDSQTVNLQRQMQKLKQLENILTSSDSLSPITLEMVENALIRLNSKKSVGSNLGRAGKNVVTLGDSMPRVDTSKILAEAGKISAKGGSPLLVPNPGGNMTPMSDSAITKQNKLRQLRLEMIKMKVTLSDLESRGINPTRNHVLNHLNTIKQLSFEKRPLTQANRPNRGPPVRIVSINPPRRGTQTLAPQRGTLALAPTSGPTIRVVNPPTPIHIQAPEQEEDLDQVIEGLTEFAKRFPQDFKDLMHNLEPDNSKDNIKHPDFNNNNINNINRNIKNDDTNNNVQHLNFNNNNNNILNGDANNNIFNNIRENNINRNTNHINKNNVNRNINQVNNNINLGNKNTNSFEKQRICVKPADPVNGKVLCNRRDLVEGSRCILECALGFLPSDGEIMECSGGTWSRTVPSCQTTLSLLIGGFNADEGELSDVELYSPKGKCDSGKIAPLPSPRRGLVAAYIDGNIIACAGVNNTESLNECWRYSPVTNSWADTQPLHSERHFGSIVGASGTLIVLGGRDGSATPMALGGMEQWREGAWHQVKTKMSLERSYQCSTAISRDKLMVTGGYSWNTILGRVETLHMSQGVEWDLLAPLQSPRYLHGCASFPLEGGKVGVLVAGGYNKDYLNSTEIYNTNTNSWRLSGEMSEPRQGAVILLVGGKPTIFGGFNNYDTYPTLVEQFDPKLGMWFPLRERLSKGRRYFSGVSVPQSMFPWCNS